MITERDLHEAIAECQGIRNPGASTCLKLASYYTILDHTQKNDIKPSYSYASEPISNAINYNGDSEFVQIINGKNINEVLSVIDELMSTLQVLNPRLYNGVISKL